MAQHEDTKDAVAKQLLSFMNVLKNDVQAHLPYTCTFMHIKTLGFIVDKKEPSMKDLAEELKVSSPAATMMIDRLVENKDIDRINDPLDRRVVRLKITKKGEEVFAKGTKIIKERLATMLSNLTKDELSKFSTILEKISTKK